MSKSSRVSLFFAVMALLLGLYLYSIKVEDVSRVIRPVGHDLGVPKAIDENSVETIQNNHNSAADTNTSLISNINHQPESLSYDEQESLWSAFSKAQRRIRPLTEHQRAMPENQGADYLASNPKQQIRARFLKSGVRLLSTSSQDDWEVVLALDIPDLKDASIKLDDTHLSYQYKELTEYYVNRPDAFEHGFVVLSRPTWSNGSELIVPIKVDGLQVTTATDRDSLYFNNNEGDAILNYSDLKVWDALGAPLVAQMEPSTSGFNILVADSGATYPITIDPIITTLVQKIRPNIVGTAEEQDSFGYTVSLSGDTAVIGTIGDDDNGSNAGAAYIFQRSNEHWSLTQKLIADDGVEDDAFGTSVSVDGNTVVIGTNENVASEPATGSAYVFVQIGNSWSQQQKLTASDASGLDSFGVSVSISGDTALIGADGDTNENGLFAGSAYVFTRIGGNWTQQQKLIATGGKANDHLGSTVSISGDTALICGYKNDNLSDSNTAYIFTRTNGAWTQQQALKADDSASSGVGLNFGRSGCVDGDTAIISASDSFPYDVGTVYVFKRTGSEWSQQQKLSNYETSFGYSIALDGDTALIGADKDFGVSSSTGSAYIYQRSSDTWALQQKIYTDDGIRYDNFGFAVSLDNNTALIGDYGDDENGSGSGSAYIFTFDGKTWEQRQELNVGDGADGDGASTDYYGTSVSIFNDTIAVGSPGDSDNGSGSGSVYIFIRNGNLWSEQQKLIASDGVGGDCFGHSVSTYEDHVLIGAYNEGSDGSAYVFERDTGTWNQEQKLLPNSATAQFGYSVSLSSNTALIGSYGDSTLASYAGCAYVFIKSDGNWLQQQQLFASDGSSRDYFGYSVSLDGDTALIGAHQNDDKGSNSGSAYIFSRNGNEWTQTGKLLDPDGTAYDWFGYSVSLSGSTALVGAYGASDEAGSNSGTASVFIFNAPDWVRQQKLIIDGESDFYKFGWSVCIDGNNALIGAHDGQNDSIGKSAYLFTRSGVTWQQAQEITAPDGETGDFFAASVSISGDTAIVGAYKDNGIDISGALATDQGSVYVFRIASISNDSDGDCASDIWEVANGFDPNIPYDFTTEDNDADGKLDIIEIYQGTDRHSSASNDGLRVESSNPGAQSLTVRYRRSTIDNGIMGIYQWSSNLEEWHLGGMNSHGIQVDFEESIVETGANDELVELTATMTAGDNDQLFIRMQVEPVE
jgi:hypothetical protein